MQVIRAKTAGFCMGVALALKKLDEAINTKLEQAKRICTYGPIIHNPQVLEAYAKQGVVCVADINEITAGDYVVIRAHGITKKEEETLKKSGAMLVDATCPKVKKAQLAIADATKHGATLLLFGEADHPEVRGLMSYAQNSASVFNSLEDLHNLELAPQSAYVLASQTTQDKQYFAQIEEYLCKELGSFPVLSTICDATSQRQAEITKIATQVEGVVVVGGKDSGNPPRLAAITA